MNTFSTEGLAAVLQHGQRLGDGAGGGCGTYRKATGKPWRGGEAGSTPARPITSRPSVEFPLMALGNAFSDVSEKRMTNPEMVTMPSFTLSAWRNVKTLGLEVREPLSGKLTAHAGANPAALTLLTVNKNKHNENMKHMQHGHSHQGQAARMLAWFLEHPRTHISAPLLSRIGSGKKHGWCNSFGRRISDLRKRGYNIVKSGEYRTHHNLQRNTSYAYLP